MPCLCTPRPFITVALLASLGAPRLAAAQAPAGACNSLGHSRPGDWAEYEVLSAAPAADEPAGHQSVHLAVVGPESGTRTDGLLRYEVTLQTGREPMILRFLAPRFPFELSAVREMVIQANGQPAVKVPLAMLEIMRQQAGSSPLANLRAACTAARIVDRGEITVPAGTFSADHLVGPQTTEAWVSTRVPFGVLRGVDAGGSELRLVRFGTAETSAAEAGK